jgi:predicted acylesterase/phospholipase RssA
MTDCLRRSETMSSSSGLLQACRPVAAGAHADRSRSPAFVLSGGGNLGALQVGMMYALVESGLRPGMIVGTSVGAINGAFLASRLDLPGITEIGRLWTSLRRKDVLGVDLGTLVGGFRGQPRHLFDASSIRRILESFLTFRRLEDAPVPLNVVATALGTGEAVVLSAGDATTALLASSAVPRLLPPVEIEGRLLVDGAAAADVPLRQAVSLGARELYVLPTAPAQVVSLCGEARPGSAAVKESEQPIVRVIPPPALHIPLGRLGQSESLIRAGYDQARAWLEGKPLPSRPTGDRRSAARSRRPGLPVS